MNLTSCRICNNSSFKEMISVKEMMFGSETLYKYYKCSSCGALQIEQPIFNNELLYSSKYYSFFSSQKSLKNSIKKLVFRDTVASSLGLPSVIKFGNSAEASALKGIIHKDTSILDVGCGSGELLGALSSLGFKHLQGLEPFLTANIVEKGWRIKKAFITEIDSNTKFDVIMLHHSFEHMDNPLEVLKKIRGLLKPNGKCLIHIPVSDSYAYEHYKENWVQLDAPRHVFLHTNNSMKLLCDQANLKIEKIVNNSGVFQFLGSEQYKMGISLNSPQSYYRSIFKRMFSKSLFTKNQIDLFQKKADDLNIEGLGDQRVYHLTL